MSESKKSAMEDYLDWKETNIKSEFFHDWKKNRICVEETRTKELRRKLDQLEEEEKIARKRFCAKPSSSWRKRRFVCIQNKVFNARLEYLDAFQKYRNAEANATREAFEAWKQQEGRDENR